MNLLRTALYVVVGLFIAPFVLLFQALGLKKKGTPIPKHFEDLSRFLWSRGIRASISAQNVQVNHAESVAALQFGLNPSNFHVVTLTHSATSELAAMVEAEVVSAPQFTGVCRNGRFVMACTFSPPNQELETQVITAFMAYPHGTLYLPKEGP